ncbi:MAG: hypothetical protein QF463_06440 [Vicinamibacterales bacterium]|jgi:hypothetical protein|nr:hypothetical protein [Acidobacteriota bacterium]MDP6373925.1 hypothetical protein [Vicinamibacterales bacterium]MDP6608688.1 hypothetical protein [Vicinamibacterales bacterium]HAK55597.1 hypothetical protein [Acidobacteriota bacterium]|tara:strand:+ start:3708 stop:4013 length:306 start_codon:yes stop_codon:yes gene_type:complete
MTKSHTPFGLGQRARSRALPASARADFYREEFIKHQRCLQQQREYFSDSAITDAETALSRILAQLDRLCCKDDADEVLGRLLRQFDMVTRVSASSDPRNVH